MPNSTISDNVTATTTTKTNKDASIEDNAIDRASNVTESKNKVKRSIGDSGLIFWNDVYDEEYGLKLDSIDNSRYKDNRGKDFIARSGLWFQDKVRRLTDNLRRPRFENDKFRKRDSRSIHFFK